MHIFSKHRIPIHCSQICHSFEPHCPKIWLLAFTTSFRTSLKLYLACYLVKPISTWTNRLIFLLGIRHSARQKHHLLSDQTAGRNDPLDHLSCCQLLPFHDVLLFVKKGVRRHQLLGKLAVHISSLLCLHPDREKAKTRPIGSLFDQFGRGDRL